MRLSICFLLVTVLCSYDVEAQSSKFKRKSRRSSQKTVPAKTETHSEATPSKDGKVDISDLEKRYWAPKDTEFNVVQNRMYKKEKRFALSLGLGPLIDDDFSKGNQLGVSLNYYFSERMGVEANYTYTDASEKPVITGFKNQHGTVPNHNQLAQFYGVSFNWIPFYAKMSVLEQKIIYFDMSISPGIGVTQYEHQLQDGSNPKKSSFTFTLDVAQHFFLSRHWALRVDVRNRFFNQKVLDYDTLNQVQSFQSHSVSVLFGATFYY